MTDVQYWKDTLEREIDSIRDIVREAPSKGSTMEKSHMLDQAERQLRSAQGTKRSFKMECRLVSDPSERRQYETELSQHEQTLHSLTSDVKALRSSHQRGELFVGADRSGNAEPDPEADGDGLLKEASHIQDKTQTSIDAIARMTGEAKNVGMETMEELRRQRDQITSIDEEAMKIEDNLVRADKLIRTFGRRIATDKFIQCFACVNVILIVAVIVFSLVKKGGVPGVSGPTEPVRRLLFLRGEMYE